MTIQRLTAVKMSSRRKLGSKVASSVTVFFDGRCISVRDYPYLTPGGGGGGLPAGGGGGGLLTLAGFAVRLSFENMPAGTGTRWPWPYMHWMYALS